MRIRSLRLDPVIQTRMGHSQGGAGEGFYLYLSHPVIARSRSRGSLLAQCSPSEARRHFPLLRDKMPGERMRGSIIDNACYCAVRLLRAGNLT
jgi:hypothetical protein